MSLAWIENHRRALQDWLARERPGAPDTEAPPSLAELRNDPRRRAQACVTAWLTGSRLLGEGFLRVFDGDGEGFDDARLGQALRRSALLLRAREQGSGRGARRLPFSLLHGAWTALIGLALHDPHGEALYDLLRQQPDGAFADDDHLPLFVRELLLLHAGRRANITARLGPFQEVLRHWQSSPTVFAPRVAELCDLQAEARRGGPFDDPPCRLYPALVLAIRHVREWLELPRVRFEHPLLFTNLGTMAPQTPWPQNGVTQRLEQAWRR